MARGKGEKTGESRKGLFISTLMKFKIVLVSSFPW